MNEAIESTQIRCHTCGNLDTHDQCSICGTSLISAEAHLQPLSIATRRYMLEAFVDVLSPFLAGIKTFWLVLFAPIDLFNILFDLDTEKTIGALSFPLRRLWQWLGCPSDHQPILNPVQYYLFASFMFLGTSGFMVSDGMPETNVLLKLIVPYQELVASLLGESFPRVALPEDGQLLVLFTLPMLIFALTTYMFHLPIGRKNIAPSPLLMVGIYLFSSIQLVFLMGVALHAIMMQIFLNPKTAFWVFVLAIIWFSTSLFILIASILLPILPFRVLPKIASYTGRPIWLHLRIFTAIIFSSFSLIVLYFLIFLVLIILGGIQFRGTLYLLLAYGIWRSRRKLRDTVVKGLRSLRRSKGGSPPPDLS